MAQDKNIIVREFKSRPLAFTLQFLGAVIILLNVWLAGKLYPLAQNLDALIVRVKAAEIDISKLQTDSVKDVEIQVDLASIKTTVTEIQTRLERIDSRLSKHLGI